MDYVKINLVSFSPTRTTHIILQEISKGIGIDSVNDLDFTLTTTPGDCKVSDNELTLFGVPVYGGRVPTEAKERIQTVSSDGSPAVIVVTYGNREFEDALLELQDIVEAKGFSVLAGGAFIGEHSFSTAAKPIAENRPDQADLSEAAKFGMKIKEKLADSTSLSDLSTPEVPGKRPYREKGPPAMISPITRQDECTECCECATVCPTRAIAADDPQQTDKTACIRCCACVKNCPSGARVMEDPGIGKIADWLFENFSTRKKPELFL